MANINIKDLLGNGEMAYDTLFTEGTFEWFKSDEDAYIYVRNNETGRCSRYNAEAQNGKRIPADVYENNEIRAKARQDEENGDALTEEELESATREVEEMISNGEIIDYKGNYIRVRGGAWNDVMNSCLLTVIDHVDGHDICTDNCSGEVFALRNFGAKAPEVEAAVEATEESQTTEETQQIAKEMAPKKKRVRKSKDVAFSIHVTTIDNPEETPENLLTLTAKQVDFIRHLPDTCFWENGLDSCIWVDVLCDEIGGQFEGKPMTVGAMISTLCEKGLGVRCKDKIGKRTATAFKLTPTGKVVAAKLGLA